MQDLIGKTAMSSPQEIEGDEVKVNRLPFSLVKMIDRDSDNRRLLQKTATV